MAYNVTVVPAVLCCASSAQRFKGPSEKQTPFLLSSVFWAIGKLLGCRAVE